MIYVLCNTLDTILINDGEAKLDTFFSPADDKPVTIEIYFLMAALLPILTSSNYTESQILEQTIWTRSTDPHRLDASISTANTNKLMNTFLINNPFSLCIKKKTSHSVTAQDHLCSVSRRILVR